MTSIPKDRSGGTIVSRFAIPLAMVIPLAVVIPLVVVILLVVVVQLVVSGPSMAQAPLGGTTAKDTRSPGQASMKHPTENSDEVHLEAFEEDEFPSAMVCGQCHPKHFDEWSSSQHAYAQLSPVFNAMHGRILQLTNGTIGDFCIRCHTPVGMALGEPIFVPNVERHPVALEGITCVVCHRMSKSYGKLNSRFAINEGDLSLPIRGPRGDNRELQKCIYEEGLVTGKDATGQKVHGRIEPFFELTTPSFCGTCHDVTLSNGFRLEEAFSEYENSPAAKRNVTCQDCHMGREPGKVLADPADHDFISKNYEYGPAACVSGVETAPRKLTSHRFVGPDYSVVDPWLFPFNQEAIIREKTENNPTSRGLATLRDWLFFDVEAGWGADEFEDEVEYDHPFPEAWASVDDRYDAREIIDENLKKLKVVEGLRLRLLRNGYGLGEIEVGRVSQNGISFNIEVRSETDGHLVPTGFDAERLVWLFVTVKGPNGEIIKRSGDLDPNGDVRDLHSTYVHNHELPLDRDLFSLQSRFLTRNLRGGEMERVLSVNVSPSPLPFLRPERRSSVLQGGTVGARKHKKGIEPNGRRVANYEVDRKQMVGSGEYRISVQLKAAMVPVNLISEIAPVGFDYGLSAREVAERVVAGHQVLWEREATVQVRTGN